MKEQIEEMAECMIEIQQNFNEYCAKPCRECELGGIVNCENYYKAEALYNAGYRKQSEGEWIPIKEEHKKVKVLTGYKCSCCKKEFSIGTEEEAEHFLATMLHCPNCGAKMKGA